MIVDGSNGNRLYLAVAEILTGLDAVASTVLVAVRNATTDKKRTDRSMIGPPGLAGPTRQLNYTSKHYSCQSKTRNKTFVIY